MATTASDAGFAAVPPGGDAAADPRRLEAWAGEARLNLVRLAAVLLFYGYHLVNVCLSRNDAALAGAYHVSVTALVMVWSAGAAALWLYLARRWPPPALKYVVTAWDTVLLTTLVVLAGDPRSPLATLYFLVIAAAPLRLSVRLVYATTLLALAAYGFLLAHYAFYQVGYERYYADASLRVPRTQEAVTSLGLAAAGVLAGQVVRQARRLLRHGLQTMPQQAAGGHAGEAGRDAEVRRDTMLVASGLVLAALLVALGLLFSATLGPPSVGGYPAWPVIAVIAVLFLVALVAALAEARRLGTRAAQGEPSTR